MPIYLMSILMREFLLGEGDSCQRESFPKVKCHTQAPTVLEQDVNHLESRERSAFPALLASWLRHTTRRALPSAAGAERSPCAAKRSGGGATSSFHLLCPGALL